MQFFHVSITFVAQKPVAPAQIEKKVDFTTFEHWIQFISVFLIKKGTFFQEFQNFILANRLENRLKNKFWRSAPYGGSNLVYYAHFEYHESFQLIRSSENERLQKLTTPREILIFLCFLKKSKIQFFSI